MASVPVSALNTFVSVEGRVPVSVLPPPLNYHCCCHPKYNNFWLYTFGDRDGDVILSARLQYLPPPYWR